jgi:valyl-tRNA synthetase
MGIDGDPLVFDVAAEALAQVRKVKTEAKVSLRTAIRSATIRDAADRIAALRLAESDVRDAGAIATLTLEDGDPAVDAELEPATA